MTEIVNLKQRRKRAARTAESAAAAANRLSHGRTRGEKEAQKKRELAHERVLSGAKIEPASDRDSKAPE